MTKKRIHIRAGKAACEAATSGKWHVGGPFPGVSVCIETDPGCGGPEPIPPTWEPVAILSQAQRGPQDPQAAADAAFIARAEYPLALDWIERAAAMLHEAEHWLDDPSAYFGHDVYETFPTKIRALLDEVKL